MSMLLCVCVVLATCAGGGGGLAGMSPMMHSCDSGAARAHACASPLGRAVPQPQMQYRAQAHVKSEAEENARELEDNSLAWMAPDFDLEQLLTTSSLAL